MLLSQNAADNAKPLRNNQTPQTLRILEIWDQYPLEPLVERVLRKLASTYTSEKYGERYHGGHQRLAIDLNVAKSTLQLALLDAENRGLIITSRESGYDTQIIRLAPGVKDALRLQMRERRMAKQIADGQVFIFPTEPDPAMDEVIASYQADLPEPEASPAHVECSPVEHKPLTVDELDGMETHLDEIERGWGSSTQEKDGTLPSSPNNYRPQAIGLNSVPASSALSPKNIVVSPVDNVENKEKPRSPVLYGKEETGSKPALPCSQDKKPKKPHPLTEEQREAIDILRANGVDVPKARNLARTYPLEQIRLGAAYARTKKAKNLPGYTVRAVEHGWCVPPEPIPGSEHAAMVEAERQGKLNPTQKPDRPPSYGFQNLRSLSSLIPARQETSLNSAPIPELLRQCKKKKQELPPGNDKKPNVKPNVNKLRLGQEYYDALPPKEREKRLETMRKALFDDPDFAEVFKGMSSPLVDKSVLERTYLRAYDDFDDRAAIPTIEESPDVAQPAPV